VAKAGTGALITSGVAKTLVFIVVSPLLGFVLGTLIMVAVSWLFFHSSPRRVDSWFRRLQLVSAALYSLGHGGNDAQKTIGIIWMLLIAAGVTGADESVPLWVIVSCYARHRPGYDVRRLAHRQDHGQKLTKLKPVGGLQRETAGGLTLVMTAAWASPYPHHPQPSPAPSSVSASASASARCAGAWPAPSCGPGCSPSPPRRSSPRRSGGSARSSSELLCLRLRWGINHQGHQENHFIFPWCSWCPWW